MQAAGVELDCRAGGASAKEIDRAAFATELNGSFPGFRFTYGLDREIKAITAMPEVQERMAKVGFGFGYADSNTFRAQVAAEHQRYGEIIRAHEVVLGTNPS